jgi:hypothetical protein
VLDAAGFNIERVKLVIERNTNCNLVVSDGDIQLS